MKISKLSIALAGAMFAAAVPSGAAENTGRVVYEPEQAAATRAATASEIRVAMVNSDATLRRGIGTIKARRSGDGPAGIYLVTFDRNITSCYYFGTLGRGDNIASDPAGAITTARAFDSVRTVYVKTFDQTGALADRNFFLQVIC